MKSKKLLFLFLALMMLLSVVPFYASAEAVALTEANVVTWPTADKEIYYGQKPKNEINLIGGVVTSDGSETGTVIPGTWEFTDDDTYLPIAGTRKANIRFVPTDSSYEGFEVANSANVKYVVNKPLPVLADENNPPVATAVEANAKLSASTLSGGNVVNPYNPDEPKALAGFWRWTKNSTIVSESGYYQARMVLPYYEILYMDVYVEVLADFEVTEYPTVPELVYDPNVTWADITLTGGKAVSRSTGEEVAGTFTVSADAINNVPSPFKTTLAVVFTPANEEDGKAYNFNIPVTVKHCPISFGPDYKGTSIDDPYVLEVAPGTEMSVVLEELKFHHLNYPGTGSVAIENQHGQAEHGRIYEYRVLNYNDANYTGKYAYVKTVFTETQVSPTIAWAGFNEYKVDCGTHRPSGTFTIFCNDVEIAEEKVGQPFTCEVYTDAGGTYNIVAKYNPVENDYFVCSDATYSVTVAPKRNITYHTYTTEILVNGHVSFNEIREGDEVVMKNTYGTFVNWIIKDTNGNTVTLDGVDVNEREISFIMPDYDLVFTYRMQEDIEREEAIANCDHLCHSDNFLAKIVWKLLNIIFRLFDVQQYCDCSDLHYDAPLFG